MGSPCRYRPVPVPSTASLSRSRARDRMTSVTASVPVWREAIDQVLPFFGHRNWILIADAAYPAHASGGIEVILTNEDHSEVVRSVLKSIDAAPHLAAKVSTDLELAFVSESDSPGLSRYREELDGILQGVPRARLPHNENITRLANAAATFRVFVIKTKMRKPYTSVFIELDCGYWSPEKESRMRNALAFSANANE